MTDKNPHLSSNRLIAAAFEAAAIGKPGEYVIGIIDGNAIVSLKFELGSEVEGKRPVRAICTGTNDTIVEVYEAWKFEDMHDRLVNQCQIPFDVVEKAFNLFCASQAVPLNKVAELSKKFGQPVPVQTNWGLAMKWPVTDSIGVMHWSKGDCTSITFVPTEKQDARKLEWRAGDQASWFRHNYPEFEKIHLAHGSHFEGIITFEAWLEGVAEAMTIIKGKSE